MAARSEWENSFWKELTVSARAGDNKSFWHVVAHGSYQITTKVEFHIHAKVWVDHFEGLYSITGGILDTELPMRYKKFSLREIALEETYNAIQGITCGNATGSDKIPGDQYVSEQHIWAP